MTPPFRSAQLPPPAPVPERAQGLPMADGGVATERADAARNRMRLLEAAARLVAEHGAEHVTMEAVACAASVGKGTVFRRFGDRVGLMYALLDHSERAFQQAFLSGPPPLGPGAPPVERLEAFGVAAIRHTLTYMDVLLETDQDPNRRYSHPARLVRGTHIAVLLREAGVTGDLALLTENLLGCFEPPLVNHLRTVRGMPVERLEAGWRDLVDRTVRRGPSGCCP
ncbi:helix-turn-helix domain-containing protein [Streptomyces sp. NPDC048845]|uniref:TetR/AcrR family transcriptional regulator n=1 Tax=Streptomyces sp. NPDC048845 TaxID=3155390 RepID=UPI0034167E17